MLLTWIAADLAWWSIADRRMRPLRRHRQSLRILLALFVGGQVAYMSYLLLRSFLDPLPTLFPMYWDVAAYLWHLVILPASLIILATTSVLGQAKRIGKKTAAWLIATPHCEQKNSDQSPGPGHASRRQMLSAMAAALPPIATVGLAGWETAQLDRFRIRRCELAIPNLPADLDGLTIAHVTDLHIGHFLPRDMIPRVADATNALGADLVAFTGDLNDISAKKCDAGIDFMRRLDPRHGLAMVEGNHDVMVESDGFEKAIKDAGLPLLLNETMTVRIPGRATPVQLMGINWGDLRSGKDIGRTGKDARKHYRINSPGATQRSIEDVLSQRNPAAFPLLLAHHPHAFDPAAAVGLPLVLSGHTHGGQIMLTPRLGAGPLRFKYWTGAYSKGPSKLFVANGVGNWFPLRLNAPAEIVHLTLRRVPTDLVA